MRRKYKSFLGAIISIFVFIGSVFIVAFAKGTNWIVVLGNGIVFIIKGIGEIIFTPYTLLGIILFLIFNKPDLITNGARQLMQVFKRIPGVEFCEVNKMEKNINASELANSTIETSENKNQEYQYVNIYKRLLTMNNANMSIARHLLYQIDKPGRINNFTLRELIGWVYGKELLSQIYINDVLSTISYSAAFLIQTEMISGTMHIDDEEIRFNNVLVSSSAHLALEQLCREGWAMTPQVTYN